MPERDADGGWVRCDAVCGAITGSDDIAKFWVLDVVTFGGSSASDGVVKTEGVVRVNRGRGFEQVVRSTWSNIWIEDTMVVFCVLTIAVPEA